jgi:hypothetical protein
MSNSAVLFVPAARCCARICLASRRTRFRRDFAGHPPSPNFGAQASRPLSASATTDSRTPMRGGWSADSLTLNLGRACAARPPCPGATGTALGAPPWRFSDADPRSRLPAVEPEPQRLPAPGINAWRSGSGPPCGAVRAASAGRHSWLRLSGSFLENAPLSQDGKSCIINSIRSQYLIRTVVDDASASAGRARRAHDGAG